MNVLGKGVYTIAQAARLTRLPDSRAREWFKGRKSREKFSRPLFQSDYPVVGGDFAISFLDLVELFIAGKLREHISLQSVRKNYRSLEEAFGEHPFCTREINVSGKQIFTRGLNETESDRVIEVLTKQAYFETVIRPFLHKIDYDEATNRAKRWLIADMVIVDPQIRFGKPVVEETGIATSVLWSSYYANEQDADFVAKWFNIHRLHVEAAVHFEDGLAA